MTVFNGDGNNYAAIIESCGKAAVVKIQTAEPNPSESGLSIHLAQGISRGDRMDTTIQKAVELGVTEISPLFTSKTAVKLAENRLAKKMQHWQNIIIGACEQSHRSVIPELHPPTTLTSWLETNDQNDTILNVVLSPDGSNTFGALQVNHSECRILVGPESGLTDVEVEACVIQGFHSVSLGPRVLRTETAGAAALAVLQTRFGDFG